MIDRFAARFAPIALCGLLFLALTLVAPQAFAQSRTLSAEEIQYIREQAVPMPFPDMSGSVLSEEATSLLFKHDPIENPIPAQWLVDTPRPKGIEGPGDKAGGPTRITNTESYPYSTVVHLYMDYGGSYAACSGAFVLNTHTILTAGHCLYNKDMGGLPDDVYVIPAQDGQDEPFGSKVAFNYAVSSAYATWEDYTQDWGVVLVDPFGSNTDYMDLIYDTNASWYYAREFDTAGYPGDQGYNGEQMWWAKAGIDEVYSRMIRPEYQFSSHPYDCIPGQSGSAIYLDQGGGNYAATAVLTLASCHSVRVSSSIENYLASFDCAGCQISGECYDDGDISPTNNCHVCDKSESTWAWSSNDGASCDDGQFCNGADYCANKACSDNDGDPCPDGTQCHEGRDRCEVADDDDDDDDDESGCTDLVDRIYNACDSQIVVSGDAQSGDDAYDLCKADDGPWDCIFDCSIHPDVDSCESFVACLKGSCDVSIVSGGSGDDDDDSGGGSCGS